MRLYPKILVVAILLGFCTFTHAGGEKKAVQLSFHIEADPTDNPKMIFPFQVGGQQKVFRRMPEIGAKDLVAFSPFPAEDQASYGALFQIKDNARRRLAAVTAVNRGKWLISHAFGRIVDGVLIDGPVDDGAIVIWKGLTLEEIREIDTFIPRIGENKKRGN